MNTSHQSLALYRQLLRASQRFTNYNFREYSLRRVRDDFRSSRQLAPADARRAYDYGVKELESLRRQVLVSELYPQTEKHAME